MNFRYVLGVGLVSGVVKVLFGQFSFIGEKIDHAQRDLVTKLDLKLVT